MLLYGLGNKGFVDDRNILSFTANKYLDYQVGVFLRVVTIQDYRLKNFPISL